MSELPYIEQLADLIQTGKPFVAVTLVEAIGSTPQDVGTKMLVTEKGLFYGTVGGGRIEMQAIEHAMTMLVRTRRGPRCLVEWNLQRDVGMTCGGVVKLFFEAYNVEDWHVVIFGAGHVAQALVRCLSLLDCRITCIDSRQEWLEKLPVAPCLKAIRALQPESHVDALDSNDFVVCMTMGHSTDLPILRNIYSQQRKLRYLGVIGSRAKRKVMLRELAEHGIPDEATDSLRCPVGLPLGTNQPAEIAISIAAEMLQVRGEPGCGNTGKNGAFVEGQATTTEKLER